MGVPNLNLNEKESSQSGIGEERTDAGAGAEATAAMLQILQSSTLSSDVAELAKGMGQAANRQYQQEFLAAVRQQLFPAQQPQSSPDTDMGPLFQVLTIRP